MSQFSIQLGGQIQPVNRTTILQTIVSTKERWGDAWEEAPYLQPRRAVEAASPSEPYAEFVYDYGQLKREHEFQFTTYDPVELIGRFILIEVIPEGDGVYRPGRDRQPLWIGRIIDEHTEHQGADATTFVERGVQVLRATGIDHELRRRRLSGAVVLQAKGSREPGSFSVGEPEPVEINRALTFNDRRRFGGSDKGNRSTNLHDTGNAYGPIETHLFSADGELWSNLDIWTYFRGRHHPPHPPVGPAFTPSGQYDDLDNIIGRSIRYEGRTFAEMLDVLIDRRRGFGWTVRANPDDLERVFVHVFSHFGRAINARGVEFTANPEQITLRFDDDLLAEPVVTRVSEANLYDRIEVLGAPVLSCFSLSFASTFTGGDENLERGWTDGEEDAYLTANSSGSSDPDLNDAVRQGDEFERVFQLFRPVRGWDWCAGDPTEAPPVSHIGWCNPRVTKSGVLSIPGGNTDPSGYFNHHRSFERFLPILQAAAADDAEPELRRPFAILPDPAGSGRYHFIERPPEGQPSGHLRMADSELGVVVSYSPNHILALTDWSDPAPTNHDPVWDYRDLILTVAARTDERLRVFEDVTSVGADGRVLTIEIPDAEAWWVVRGTVIDVQNGDLVLHTGDMEVRNDRDELNQILVLAWSWYAQERRAISITYKDLVLVAPVGTYIKEIASANGSLPAGTVVTRREWDFQRGRTKIETEFANLDFGTIARPSSRRPRG